jgi:long-chain acyl-CoA synthetase
MKNNVFITGATGNIGAKLVTRILQDKLSDRLILLIRGKSVKEAALRLISSLQATNPDLDFAEAGRKIKIVCGDITKPGLGLSITEQNELVSEVTHIIHSAASTKFQQPLDKARFINYGGTKNVLKFAGEVQKNGNFKGLAHISTAYICGRREETIYENETENPVDFSNPYEQTKWESENLVNKEKSKMPITIFRPSIVVGDSISGRINSFNVLYTPLKFILGGSVKILPCRPNTPTDVVSVDFVSNAICHIFLKTDKWIGKNYNLTAGEDNSNTVREIIDYAVNYYNNNSEDSILKQMRYVHPELFNKLSPILGRKINKIHKILKPFEPYVCLKRNFDNTNTINALQGTNIIATKLTNYFDNILRYYLRSTRSNCLSYAA